MNVKFYCGCCLLEGCFKDMNSEFNNEKRYTDLIQNTFNVIISNTYYPACMICEVCINRLKDAASFKEQVLKAQISIKDLMNSKELNKERRDIDGSDNQLDCHIGNTQTSTIKLSEEDNLKIMSIIVKPISNYLPNDADFSKNPPNITIPKMSVKHVKKKNLTDGMKSTAKVKNIVKKSTGKLKIEENKLEYLSITRTELNSRENTLNLIQNSNLCLFRSLKTRFGCFLCKTDFVDVAKLREHSSSHTNSSLLAFRINKCRGLSFKNADISQLKCNKCSKELLDLTELMCHLKSNHDVPFSGTNHFLIPYKLIDGYQCVICDIKFLSFLRLSIHMNTHYKNNVCENCGLSFINRMSLRTHVQSMHKEKKCSLCPAKFLTVASKVKHLKKAHNYFNSKRYCNLCDKTFRYTYILHKHKIDEHGAKKIIVSCKDCAKTFFSEANLRIHIRSVHNKERNYQCEICGTRFFTKCDQKRHERTHTDVRSFCCSYCDAKFKSKDSCRRHMKRQHGHVFT